ncbi:hypothetical protein PAMC26510_07245 [Caballeronia sordidicola]|jgi:hypothetical protein|uniref:Uncharacterized protein n=2 Tax=Burkholderiales TaxID=80840 RepID=A0A242N5X4_CABSO|nr:hypothetical protein PAMC26510_07245 [Caballeronia sordidicola]
MTMKTTKKFALLGALAFALAGPAMAQSGGGAAGAGGAGGGNSGGPNAAPGDPTTAAPDGTMKMHKKGMGGTTLHQQDKKSRLHGASAAAAASAMGTNDKGAPH